MATLHGYCEKCNAPVSAYVANEDLRREGEEGFAAYLGVEDVTCSNCGTVLGEKPEANDA